MNCSQCEKQIKGTHSVLQCCSCKGTFHLECLNITKACYAAFSADLKRNWRCVQCMQITRRIRNDNTPIRSLTETEPSRMNDTTMSIDDFLLQNRSVLGETIPASDFEYKTPEKNGLHSPTVQSGPCTLQQISQLLDAKFESNKNSILTELRMTIQIEINQAISKLQAELSEKTNTLSTEQLKIKKELQVLNNQIINLEKERQDLKNELQVLKRQTIISESTTNIEYDRNKKIVLYGLNETHHETELNLHQRIVGIFGDILNINLVGYIEEITRIGKKGFRRPIVIELISKRMTKYIINNARYFKNTGFAISEYLTGDSLKQRNERREKYMSAKTSGKHAGISGNKFSVNNRPSHPSRPSDDTHYITQHSQSQTTITVPAEEQSTTPTQNNQNNPKTANKTFRN